MINASLSDFPTNLNGKTSLQTVRKGDLIWYTDSSETSKGTGTGLHGYGRRQKGSFSLQKYSIVFQAEMYAIKVCMVKNLDMNYRNRNIYILSGSQTAIKFLSNHPITSKLVWDCYQSIMQLDEHNRAQFIWVQGHVGTDGNKMADQLAKLGCEGLFIGP
jgi:ribonuclease HI